MDCKQFPSLKIFYFSFYSCGIRSGGCVANPLAMVLSKCGHFDSFAYDLVNFIHVLTQTGQINFIYLKDEHTKQI